MAKYKVDTDSNITYLVHWYNGVDAFGTEWKADQMAAHSDEAYAFSQVPTKQASLGQPRRAEMSLIRDLDFHGIDRLPPGRSDVRARHATQSWV